MSDRPSGPGPVHPHDVDSEMAVLGGVLLRPSAVNQLVDRLVPDDFYVPANAEVYRAMLALVEAGTPIDLLTIEAKLQACGRLGMVGGIVYLGELLARTVTAENILYYARRVRDLSLLRGVIRHASEAASAAFRPESEPGELIEATIQHLYELAQRGIHSDYVQVRGVLREALARLEAHGDRPSGVTGVPTGYADLDRLTCGLQPGELVVLAARPGMGKTSLAECVGRHVSKVLRLPVLTFSLEMARGALGERSLYAEASVDSNRARGGQLTGDEWSRLYEAGTAMANAPLYLDDTAAITLGELRAKARRWRSDRSIFPDDRAGLIVVDYLQLVRPTARRHQQTREQEVAEISGGLKALAKDLGVPVLALAQLSRRAEERDGPPRLSDLRESGSVEQDADVVLFLHRDGGKRAAEDVVKLIIAKQRNGPPGYVRLRFVREFTRFESLPHGAGAPAPSSDEEDF